MSEMKRLQKFERKSFGVEGGLGCVGKRAGSLACWRVGLCVGARQCAWPCGGCFFISVNVGTNVSYEARQGLHL